jgi:peptide/nickel transport system substrate-binding protein
MTAGDWLRQPRPRRRRLLSTALMGGGAAAFLAACGGSSSSKENEGTGAGAGAAATTTPSGSTAATRPGETPKVGGSVSTRIAATPPLDPITNTTVAAQTAASFPYSRLLKLKTDSNPATADNYEPIPELASGYEVTADGLQFTFKLKQAKFHNKPPVNGRQATAEDVLATLERFRTDPKNTNRAIFGTPQNPVIEKAEAPDAQTVVIKLAKPFGPFLSLVANAQYLWVMPKEIVAGSMNPAQDQIGTGPFIFDSIQPDIEVKYKRNPEFFDAGKPYLDELRLVILSDSNQEVVQFQAKRLEVAAIPHEQIDDVKKSNADAQIVNFLSATIPFLAPQQRGNSPFKDERVRRAISMSVDRDAMLDLSWDGLGIWQNMVPGSFGKWHVDPKKDSAGQYFKYNPKEAVALLKAAGYDEGKKLDFRYVHTPNGYTVRYNQWAESVAGMLKETKVFNPTMAPADYLSEYIKTGGVFYGAYEGVAFMLQSGFSDPNDYLRNPLHSASQRNHAGINDPQLDQLLDKEQATVDTNERLKLVQELQRYVMDKVYYAPMFIGPDYIFLQPQVRNYYVRRGYGAGSESFLDLWLNK